MGFLSPPQETSCNVIKVVAHVAQADAFSGASRGRLACSKEFFCSEEHAWGPSRCVPGMGCCTLHLNEEWHPECPTGSSWHHLNSIKLLNVTPEVSDCQVLRPAQTAKALLIVAHPVAGVAGNELLKLGARCTRCTKKRSQLKFLVCCAPRSAKRSVP